MSRTWRPNSTILEVNALLWLQELTEREGRPITLGSLPDRELDHIAALGFDAVWVMGVWERSEAAKEIARSLPAVCDGIAAFLPDFGLEDVVASPYAIYRFRVDPALGGDEGLASLRDRLAERRLRLILDFVHNHLARDHPWLEAYPERFIRGTSEDLKKRPRDFFASKVPGRETVFAHGRDPNFDGWPDTVQLDLRRSDTREALIHELLSVAKRCDGVRCDMAMLACREVFLRTWGGEFEAPATEFWEAAISRVKEEWPDFLTIAEVYWDLEHDLLSQGFDLAYDKRLYDRLLGCEGEPVSAHLRADPTFQSRLLRFVENHDEPRALTAFGPRRAPSRALLALTVPGARLIHAGQMEGRRVRVPVQAARLPTEPPDPDTEAFYRTLLAELDHPVFHEGRWSLVESREAWKGEVTHRHLVFHEWRRDRDLRVVAANLSDEVARGYFPLTLPRHQGYCWHLEDLEHGGPPLIRSQDQLASPGLYVELPPHGHHLFALHHRTSTPPPGFRKLHVLRPRNESIFDLSWSPDGMSLATAGTEGFVSLWDIASGAMRRRIPVHGAPVRAVAWSPDNERLAAGSDACTISLFDREDSGPLRVCHGHRETVLSLSWSEDGNLLASGSFDHGVRIWTRDGDLVKAFCEATDAVNCVAWLPGGRGIAWGAGDGTIHVRDLEERGRPPRGFQAGSWVSKISVSPNGQLLAAGTGAGGIEIWDLGGDRRLVIRQGHTSRILDVAFSPDGRLLASKSADHTVRLWRCDDWRELAVMAEYGEYLGGIKFAPVGGTLAVRGDLDNAISIWSLDLDTAFSQDAAKPVRYVSARVVLVGASGTGKTCLARALMELEFEPQPATNAMRSWILQSSGDELGTVEERREVLLWDLAGQSDYELVNQLFLDQTDVAVVVFDPSDPDAPFSGVDHWSTAIRRVAGENCARLLVAGRVDVGGPAVGRDRIDRVLAQHGFRGFVRTSSRTGEGVDRLREEVLAAIPWEHLPVTSSPELWARAREFLREESRHRVLASRGELLDHFREAHHPTVITEDDFASVIRHAQTQGLVWRLSFGELVLLQTELLSLYASAVVGRARGDPNEEGTVPLEDVLSARLDLSEEERVPDSAHERLLLHAVVELFLEREVAVRFGKDLLFPSKVCKPPPPRPEAWQSEAVFEFRGPVEHVYATLISRLFYVAVFELEELWSNGAQFRDTAGSSCRIDKWSPEPGTGALRVWFEGAVTLTTRALLLKLIHDHLQRTTLADSVHWQRTFYCPSCSVAVEGARAVERAREQARTAVYCQYCRAEIPLRDQLTQVLEDPAIRDRVRAEDRKADDRRKRNVDRKITETKEEIKEYDVFLSYSRTDEDAVAEIAEQLRLRGCNPWFFPERVPPGTSLPEGIGRGLRASRTVAVFVGDQQGRYQRREMESAVHLSAQAEKPVIPVLLPGISKLPEWCPELLSPIVFVSLETTNDADRLQELARAITEEGTL